MKVRPYGIQLVIGALLLGISLSACKTRSRPSELHDMWVSLLDTKWKAVQEVADRNEYIRVFAQLPLSARLKPSPWSDGIYPDSTGGITTSIEKYDRLLDHKQSELTIAERNRIKTDQVDKQDVARSLDQDWAAAALLFAEPGPAKLKSAHGDTVAFGASDIKALLMRFVHQHSRADDGVETRSLGGLCHLDSDTLRRSLESRTLSPESWRDLQKDECFKVNAGAFHLALGNLLGLRGESFVIDPTTDTAFNYFPVQGFSSEVMATPIENDEQHQELQIRTLLEYVLPSIPSDKRIKILTRTVEYRYKIELDEAGEIVNGTWLGQSFPQLVWVQNRPKFTGDDAMLEKLYTASVGLPSRLAIRDYAAMDTEDLQLATRDTDPLVINKKYRLELRGDVPQGADGLRNFLKTALRAFGPVSVYRNTFADEDALMSIEVQFHQKATFRSLKEAIRSHSNGRAEITRVLR